MAERLLDELSALSLIYGDELSISPPTARRQALCLSLSSCPSVKLHVECPPANYPSDDLATQASPTASLETAAFPQPVLQAMRAQLTEFLTTRETPGELLLELCQLATELVDDALAEANDADDSTAPLVSTTTGDTSLAYRVIYSHHIISDVKRKLIRQWASELELGGFVKVGWPGAIVVEGTDEACTVFTQALSRLQWKRLQVRYEDTSSASSDRKFPKGVVTELHDPGGMAALAKQMRSVGLGEHFETLLN